MTDDVPGAILAGGRCRPGRRCRASAGGPASVADQSLTIAIVMLASTQITISTCIQIQKGDTP